MKTIDLRSDTVTRPTPAMRAAMAAAEVGDDVYGEDPTVNRLQAVAAERLGTQAAIFVPSWTMANQAALRALTQAGDVVLGGTGCHLLRYESGAAAALSGVQVQTIGQDGLFGPDDVLAALPPHDHHYAPVTTVAIENTHNYSGGRVFPFDHVRAIAAAARERGLKLHFDGARLWNAVVASGIPAARWADGFDSVAFCLSKGLGAPVGSLVCGSAAFVDRVHRIRKMLGGGMRQAGILAAAGLYALEHNVKRLADDHANARRFAEAIARLPGIAVELASVETNIVIWDLLPEVPIDAADFVTRARAAGLLLNAIGARRIRAVTHLDVDAAACAAGAEIAAAVLRAA